MSQDALSSNNLRTCYVDTKAWMRGKQVSVLKEAANAIDMGGPEGCCQCIGVGGCEGAANAVDIGVTSGRVPSLKFTPSRGELRIKKKHNNNGRMGLLI